jgi:antitoxin (DNA-binding transcriptional repressor) of toxin-antitoxin stability system
MPVSNKGKGKTMRQVDVSQFSTKLADLLKAIEGGETIAIARNGETIAHLVPTQTIDPKERKKPLDKFLETRKPLNVTWQELASWKHEVSDPCQH